MHSFCVPHYFNSQVFYTITLIEIHLKHAHLLVTMCIHPQEAHCASYGIIKVSVICFTYCIRRFVPVGTRGKATFTSADRLSKHTAHKELKVKILNICIMYFSVQAAA